MYLLRSLLFAPGNHARRVEKALTLDADAVILDLEDAVPVDEKIPTRALVAAALRAPRPKGPRGYIRVNGYDTDLCFGDLEAVIAPGVDGIVLPMVESALHLQAVDWVMANLERSRGLEPGAIDLVPIIETGLGLARAGEIAASDTRVRCLSFGAADFTADMKMIWTPEEQELNEARARVVLESRAAELDPPVDTVFADLNDEENAERSAIRARQMGFQGKLCIHPKQVEAINRAFTPGAEEMAKAEKILAAFAEAEAEGSASIQVDGYFVDYAIVVRARRTLALSNQIREKEKA